MAESARALPSPESVFRIERRSPRHCAQDARSLARDGRLPASPSTPRSLSVAAVQSSSEMRFRGHSSAPSQHETLAKSALPALHCRRAGKPGCLPPQQPWQRQFLRGRLPPPPHRSSAVIRSPLPFPASKPVGRSASGETPFTVARHSMQMPMPQKGARASPRAENRLGSLAIMIAAATCVPSATCTGFPLIVMENPSLFICAGSLAPTSRCSSVILPLTPMDQKIDRHAQKHNP